MNRAGGLTDEELSREVKVGKGISYEETSRKRENHMQRPWGRSKHDIFE